MNHTLTNKQDNGVSHEIAVDSMGPIGIAISQDLPMSSVLASEAPRIPTSPTSIPAIASNPLKVKRDILPVQSPSSKKPKLSIFSGNGASPSLPAAFPSSGTRFENVAQPMHCINLLRKLSSTSSIATATVFEHLDPTQRALIGPYTQNEDDRNRIRSLVQMFVEEFAADYPKIMAVLPEVLLLAPSLDLKHYRKLLTCVITEFARARSLDIALLQGLVQLVESASPDYLESGDLVQILVVLRTRLQDPHQQSTKHLYYLTWALSCLLDFMVEGKVKDLRCEVYQEPLSALFNQLKETDDPYLRCQAMYAFQGLLHVSNDDARRQCMLRYAGNITMGLLGVSSVCKLDLGRLKDGDNLLNGAAGEFHEFGSKIIGGLQSLIESGQRTRASTKEGMFSRGRQLWYIGLREAQQHIRNGRLQDFNNLVFEAPCRDHIDFQWGICRLIGEIAFDALWETNIRLKAVDFLSDLYKNDLDWTTSEGVRRWILDILRMVVAAGDSAVSAHAELILQGLENAGDVAKHELNGNTMASPLCSYLIQSRLSIPGSSTLLPWVLAIPAVDYDLLRLKGLRLEEQENILYIHPQAKPAVQASDDTLFPLMEKVLEFLASPAQVFLLLGDSGGGKSSFNLCLERTLWKSYKKGNPIPLHINLPSIDNPQQDMIAKQLRQFDFTDKQITELKQNRQFIVICDGYDESQLVSNIYTSNHFNQPGQWKVKMIVTCRTQYLGSNYRNWFIPQGNSAYGRPDPDLFQEAVIAPFTEEQIERYIDMYVPLEPRPWNTKDYMEKLSTIPNLMDLVKNPFLLSLAVEALPGVTDGKQDLSEIEVTRVQLYDTFVQHWMEVNERRLQNNNALSSEDQRIRVQLVDEGFVSQGIDFSAKLAREIFYKQDGNPVVEYVHSKNKNTWKVEFFGPQAEARILRESSPLTRTGKFFRFVHRSLQEYFFSRAIFNPNENDEDLQHETVSTASKHLGPLFQRNLLQEPSVINFLCDRVKLNPGFRNQLRIVIDLSKTDANAAVAATNAITILVRAGTNFNGEDLRGIKIPGADLSSGQFDSAQFRGANLRDVNFSKCWLRRADMSEACMEGVRFGELPYLEMDGDVRSCAYSPDGKMLGAGLSNGIINIYDTATWTRKHCLEGHSGKLCSIVFSQDNQRLVSGGSDETVRLWDTASGGQLLVMEGHTDAIFSVAISPCGNRIASAGDDETVRLWSMQTGEPLIAWKGHYSRITSIEFSPDGLQLATGSLDRRICLWNAKTGELRDVLSTPAEPGSLFESPSVKNSETGEPVLEISLLSGQNLFSRNVCSLAYSPDGRWLAAGHLLGFMQLWDTITLEQGPILSGHISSVTGIAFSSDGRWITSSSQDNKVMLWDALTNTPVTTLTGHNASVNCVAFSPDGHQIASGGDDRKLRLWEVGYSWSSLDPRYGVGAANLEYSPDGRSLHSYNKHDIFLKWDATTGTSAPIHFEIVPEEKGEFASKAFARDGSQLAFGYDNGTIRLWNCQTSRAGLVLEGHSDCIIGLKYSPCCRWILSNALNCTVQLWDLHEAEPKPLSVNIDRNLGSSIGTMTFSPSGDRFAISHGETIFMGTICIFDTLSRECQHRIEKKGISSLAFSPNGRQVAIVTKEGNIILWDLRLNKPGAILNGDEGRRHLLGRNAFSPCGQWIASTCYRTVAIWHRQLSGEVESWSRVHSVTGFLGQVYSVAWHPIIPMELVTTVSDGSVQVWRMSIDEAGNVSIKMVWGTNMSILCTDGAVFAGTVGISPMYRELLTQRGATELP